MTRKLLLIISLLLIFLPFSRGNEGMWVPLLLKYNEAEMQRLGFKLSADDIYSVNHHSMKDAIVLFGSGCTGELISPNGLLLTNHHCGYSYIQSHSSLEHNYLQDGFWAKNYADEIPVRGLTVTFLARMEDVTSRVLQGVSDYHGEQEREKIIQRNIAGIEQEAKGENFKETGITATVKPFFYGNQYFLFVNKVFRDVRIVGTPPESIGKFGGDTDNWMWPRHTGDFSLFRIYTDKDGNPADYSPDNIPLQSSQFFKISLKGVQENDFTLVFGYPGTTHRFWLSDGVDLTVNVRNPVAIGARGTRLDIMKKYMNEDPETRLMYSAKANSISNGWKKWIGENKGILECRVIEHKKQKEIDFQNWVMASPDRQNQYGEILPQLHQLYKKYNNTNLCQVYTNETFPAVELPFFMTKNVFPFIQSVKKRDIANVKDDTLAESVWQKEKSKLLDQIHRFYGSYYKPIDKEIFVSLMHHYFSSLPKSLLPVSLQSYCALDETGWQKFADKIYEQSIFKDEKTLTDFVKKCSKKKILKLENQDMFALMVPALLFRDSINKAVSLAEKEIDRHYRLYVKALMEKDTGAVFFPDANLTLRVTYGQVKGFSPADGIDYRYYTTLDGVLAKENPDIYDYKVDERLKSLCLNRDYGRYANSAGELPVAFIAANHTTGGNSGSPVINNNGELIGVNFDRVWEGTMSDLYFDAGRCRNISLDIRYFLFVVDKFAHANNILNELSVVE
ncbi:MAG: S46 family peptidase [Bacteroidales bacterium]|nr:S46 family peptidase [Bacteroidales bacterium]